MGHISILKLAIINDKFCCSLNLTFAVNNMTKHYFSKRALCNLHVVYDCLFKRAF
jgi:hypothetical protein